MAVVDFGKTKGILAGGENARNLKVQEMKKLYTSLTENQEVLDMLMIQIGKDIEEKFPGVKFRLIARIKTEKSFQDKLDNDLAGLVDRKKIEEVRIYDIIALALIIEEVPDSIKSNNESFNSHIAELIGSRNDTKTYLDAHNLRIKEYGQRIERLRNNISTLRSNIADKQKNKKFNDDKIEELSKLPNDPYGIVEHLIRISQGLKQAVEEIEGQIAEIEKQIGHIQEDIDDMKIIISRTKDRLAKEENECNHFMADFIIANIAKFDNVKTLGLTEIPKRYKQKNNYDGYRASHDCYEAKIKVTNKDGKIVDFHFICEIQGKSIDSFYVADRGKAAKYHIGQTLASGKKLKEKKLPDIANIKNTEQLIECRKEVMKKVPRFRIYRRIQAKDGDSQDLREVYKLSLKECFMIYYYNQLFGNPGLNIEPQETEVLRRFVETENLPEKDFQVYRNYEYMDRGEM